jgi:hypothetical protein
LTAAARRKKNKGWIIVALAAIVLFVGDVAVEVLSDDLKRVLEPYRIYVWSALVLAFVTAVFMTIREWRAKDDPPQEQPQAGATSRPAKSKTALSSPATEMWLPPTLRAMWLAATRSRRSMPMAM